MDNLNFETFFVPLLLSLKLALLTTIILLILCTPLAWWISRKKTILTNVVEAITGLPIILPPTVIGFYLLLFLGPNGFLGQLSQFFTGEHLAFSFIGILLGSLVYSLPFVISPLCNEFRSMGKLPMEVAATLGMSPLRSFFKVALPMARQGYLSAALLGFAHTLGEFGVVLMIGGNLPGKTQVASIAIYERVEALDYTSAHLHSLILLVISFFILLYFYGRKNWRENQWHS